MTTIMASKAPAPGGEIISESGGAIISEQRGGFVGIGTISSGWILDGKRGTGMVPISGVACAEGGSKVRFGWWENGQRAGGGLSRPTPPCDAFPRRERLPGL